MAKKNADPKTLALTHRGCLNKKADDVRDELFRHNRFFDQRDIVQVRYEMIRRVKKDGIPVQKASDDFGVTRTTWYQNWNDFDKGGLPALVPARPGPRQAHKLKPHIVGELQRIRNEHPDLRIGDLVKIAEERFDIRVHPRSIERALQNIKKNRRPK